VRKIKEHFIWHFSDYLIKVSAKFLFSIFIKEVASIMWPVDDTGKNSVNPSIIAIMSACRYDIV